MFKKVAALMMLFSLVAMAAPKQEVVEREMSLDRGGSVSLKNINGSVTVRGWNKDTVKVKATKKARGGNEAGKLSRTAVNIHEDSTSIEVETEFTDRARKWRNNVSVTYEIWVPEEVVLNARTTNGKIIIEGVVGTVSANSTNGSVTVNDVSGSINAHTTNGSITARLVEHNGENMNFHTTNGSIKLAAPANFAADLNARTTNGSIKTDLPLTVTGAVSKHKMNGTLNGGGSELVLKTTNGSIRIAKL